MKILLTRPIDESITTSKILSKIGIETSILPFLEIKSFDYKEFIISKSDYIMFTSKNAANFFRFKKQFRGKGRDWRSFDDYNQSRIEIRYKFRRGASQL